MGTLKLTGNMRSIPLMNGKAEFMDDSEERSVDEAADRGSYTDFSDMDDLDSQPAPRESVAMKARKAAAPMIPCARCRGTGSHRCGVCYNCKGTGQVRADWQKRRNAFLKGEATKAQNLLAKIADWRIQFPAENGWLEAGIARGDRFACSLNEGLDHYGRLTDGQMAAVQRAIAKDDEFKTKREAEAVANQVDVQGDGREKLVASLNRAKANGMKREPHLIVGGIDFQRAPDSGKNPGSVYVKGRHSDRYLGKITTDGAFQPSRECTEEMKMHVARIMLDPLAAAIEHGKLTGECSCCGRKLTDPQSVAAGIGPICASNFFGG